MTTRREWLVALIAGALAAPFDSIAQKKGKVWRIGFLDSAPRETTADSDRIPAFLQGMKELGYVEGKHFVFEARFADGNSERLSALAAELAQLNVAVIITNGITASQAAQRTTTTIPIVVTVTPDPVRDGLAMSLAKPSGNLTGLSSGIAEVIQKHVELLLTVQPRVSRIAVLMNSANAGHPPLLLSVQVAAQRFGRHTLPVAASTPQEIERGFALMTRNKADAVIVLIDALFRQHRRQIAELALRHRLPSSYPSLLFADGALFAYAANLDENFRRAATFVDKILKGARPGDLPFELPTKFELVVNMRTAKELGLTVPQSILVRADRLIE